MHYIVTTTKFKQKTCTLSSYQDLQEANDLKANIP